jgi:hypothetical protein
MARQELTAERLREVLHYDPETGLFTWRIDRGGRKAGTVAGSAHNAGYVSIRVYGIRYLSHRLAALYVTGKWPEHQVDHKYGVRSDNRWTELRPATHAQNQHNKRSANSNNKVGLLGVSVSRGRYLAQIKVAGKRKFLGRFGTPEMSHNAYLTAKAAIHPFQTLVEKTCTN